VITLTLLHPMQSIPVQSWTFEQESVIRIGRSTDNHVILYSAVVSRHHVEIRKTDSGWEIVNLGANGTYLEGKRISQVPVENGVVIRLARSGPNVQIHITSKTGETVRGDSEPLANPVTRTGIEPLPNIEADIPLADQDDEPTSSPPPPDAIAPDGISPNEHSAPFAELASHQDQADEAELPTLPEDDLSSSYRLLDCCQRYLSSDRLFCLDCGKPLKVLTSIADYHIVKTLEQDSVGSTQLAWRKGQTFLLQTLNSEWTDHPEAIEVFELDAKQLLTLNHAGLPHFVDVFVENGRPYLVLEPTYGQTLQQLVNQDGPLDLATTLAWLTILCAILQYLHQQEPPILHQDLKPENLVCRPSNSATPLTIIGFTPGKVLKTAIQEGLPGYTAPEQQHGQASPQSDLYALAPILMFLLTGKPPAVFYAQQEQGMRFRPEYLPGLPSELVAVLHRLTHAHAEERYESAKDLAEALKSTI
jgi:Protein kinase domain/FHA domain